MPIDELVFWIGLGVGGLYTAFLGGLYWKTMREDRELRARYGLPRRR